MMADENRFKEGMRKLFLPITAPLRFIQEHFKAMIFLLLLFVIFAPSNEQSLLPNNLQHIALKGPIFDAGEIVHELDTAAQNRAVKGVLVDVSSPGGAVAPTTVMPTWTVARNRSGFSCMSATWRASGLPSSAS